MGMALGIKSALGMQPEVEEVIGGPEFFVDGWILQPGPEIMTGILFCERHTPGKLIRYETVRLHFPASRWKRSNAMTMQMVRHAPHLFLLKPGH